MSKNKLKKIWGSKKYLDLSRKGSMDNNHPGMVILKKLVKNADSVLDLGCGSGTRLNYLTDNGRIPGLGVDISEKAIEKATKSFPKLKFVKADLENLPLKKNDFDLVYSAFVLEHLDDPEKIIEEAIRVLKPNGKLAFIAPNFGAPNRASPSFKGSRPKKLIKGFLKDMFFIKDKGLNWDKVKPLSITGKYELDWDTTVEPYILSLLNYLNYKEMRIVKYSSCWSEELPNAKFLQKLFSFLGKIKIYPFSMWGPHLVVVSRKN